MKTELTLWTFSASLLFILISCGQTTHSKQAQTLAMDPKTIDTSKYAILVFDTTDTWLFEKANPSSLTQAELEEIDSILNQYIDSYNPGQQLQFDTISKAHPEYDLKLHNFIIDLSRYKRQYFPVITFAGQKEVWVNCFCNDFDKNWRREMLIVHDGGNCYFSLIINLVTKKASRFIINGEA